MVIETEEKVQRIIHNLKEAQAWQKNYADKRGQPLVFQVNDHVYLKVSPMKGVNCFGVKRKLAPRYIGLFLILERYGLVAYQLQLSETLSTVHNVFHVSQLKKCFEFLIKPSMWWMLSWNQIWLIQNIPFKFWIRRTGSPKKGLLNSIRYNGTIILKMKLPGRLKISWKRIFLGF